MGGIFDLSLMTSTEKFLSAEDAWVGDFLLVVVMAATLCDLELTVLNAVDQTIFFIDPAAEVALQVSFQCFRFADTIHRAVPVDVFDEHVNAFEDFLVLCLPIQVVLPCLIRPDFIHRPRSARGQCRSLR